MNVYVERFLEPATYKPKISSLSLEFGLLIFLLCGTSFMAGALLTEALLHKGPTSNDGMNLASLGMGLLTCLATQFCWTRRITFCLRVAFLLAILVYTPLICWQISSHL